MTDSVERTELKRERDLVVSYNNVVDRLNDLLAQNEETVGHIVAALRTETVEMHEIQVPLDPLQASAVLSKAMGDLTHQVEGLAKYGRTNRKIIRIAVASVVFDIVLSIALGVLAFQAHHNSSAVTVNCRAANQAKAAESTLWNHVLALPQQAPQTAEQKAQTAQFKTYIAKSFKQEKC